MNIQKLSLYHYDSCPYCAYARSAIKQLDVNVELRNIHQNSEHWKDLIANGGKAQVPCLLIEQEDGTSSWLYESEQIVSFFLDYSQHQQDVA